MSERRRFFRINDKIGVAYRVLTEAEMESQQDEARVPVDTFSLLSRYENTISELLPQVATQSPVMAEILDTLNKKVNCIIAQLELDSRLVRRIAHRVKEVNISACGMAFVVEEDVGVDKVLTLDLVLHPDDIHIATFASVLDCTEQDKGFYLRLNFLSISPQDQEKLIQHIVKRQGSLLRAIRSQGDSGKVVSDHVG